MLTAIQHSIQHCCQLFLTAIHFWNSVVKNWADSDSAREKNRFQHIQRTVIAEFQKQSNFQRFFSIVNNCNFAVSTPLSRVIKYWKKIQLFSHLWFLFTNLYLNIIKVINANIFWKYPSRKSWISLYHNLNASNFKIVRCVLMLLRF